MYKIEFYEKADGSSPVLDFLEMTREKAKTSKDARIQFRKKTQKTPKKEIEKAKAERRDYISRKGE